MKNLWTKNQSGDTIVEVLLATVVLSVIVAGAYTLTTRSTQLNQEAFERTQVSNFVQGQAELVRAARDTFIPTDITATDSLAWAQIETTHRQTSVAPLGADCDTIANIASERNGEFHMVFDGAGNLATSNTVLSEQEIYRVWIEAEDNGSYWDIHVFGCWDGLSTEVALRTSIVMRLDDPR